MSDSSDSFWKLIAVFLFLALAGVYSLYDWYGDRLKAEIVERDALIDQSRSAVHDADERRLQSEAEQKSIRSQIQSLKEQHQAELDRLAGRIDALKQEKAQLELAIDGSNSDHLVELDAARRKLEQVEGEKQSLEAANAELEKLYEAAHERAISLKNDLDKVDQAIAKTAEEHQAKIAELERHLNERVNLARTTPMDETLVRAAQEVGVLPKPEGDVDGADLQGLTQQLDEANAKLESLAAEHEATREQLAEAQARLEQTQDELEGAKADLASAREPAQSGAADEAPAAELEDLNQRLAAERKVRAALQGQHEAAIAALQTSLEEAKAKLAASTQELDQARVSLDEADQVMAQRLDEAQAKVASLETDLEQERAKVADLQSGDQDALQAAREKLARLETELEQARSADVKVDETAAKRLAQAQGRIAALEETLAEVRQQMKGQGAEVRLEAEAKLAKLRELSASYADLGGTYTAQGVLVRLPESELRFPPGQSQLPSGDLPSLNRIAKLLARHSELSVRVEGHTDSSGGSALNRELSLKRAEAVRDALVERGVDADRIVADGLGSERPIADNATSRGRSLNRRVEIYLRD
ncbi:OmpA family protein [Imhoffiella purpurea]|uniref:OmpA-like domain-containing protein n=1 Tax=Imhoffiella purpurea TaxID=1249627 RepID=W9VHQ6_9GAMM|nr:OmpA family protein [Imhoffiella purpurea]EXJ15582.1 hypothetical protein D779_1324 [Imhoffiella purpurea]